ncbi:hypothetical protein EJB05_57752, partial [Eragrostis curvula]
MCTSQNPPDGGARGRISTAARRRALPAAAGGLGRRPFYTGEDRINGFRFDNRARMVFDFVQQLGRLNHGLIR